MPFVALKMSATTESSALVIGSVIGFGPLASILIGFYVGHLSDLLGRRLIIFFAILLWAFAFLGFSLATHPLEYGLLMSITGLARGVFEPVSTALLSDLCDQNDPSGKQHQSAFHLRYFAINVGACIGPLTGASLLIRYPKLGFQIATLVYFISAWMFLFMSNYFGVKTHEKNRVKSTHRFRDVLNVLKKDQILQIYTIAFFFISLSYSQIESTLTLHLKELYAQDGIALFAKLLTLNAIVVVLCTIPLLSWVKKYELNTICTISSIIWAIGYFGVGISKTPLHYMISMAIMTLGEIIIFANGYLLIESLAPKQMKGAYFGVTNVAQTGMMIGPALGGYILMKAGGTALFSIMGLFMMISACMYFIAKKYFGKNITLKS